MAERLAESEARERNFLMSVSHELRTPLTAIRGHVPRCARACVEDPELRALSLEIVEAEATRLERLVGDILDLAKLDAHRFTVLREEVDMEQLVEQAYETFSERGAARGRSTTASSLNAGPVIVSDGDRVLQIVGNLLSNAFRATPDGGRIQLELGAANGTVEVAVEDTGPGIAAGRAGAALPAVRLGRRQHGARTDDRAGALDRARRPDRAGLDRRPRLAVRAGPAGVARPGGAEPVSGRRLSGDDRARGGRASARSGRGARSSPATGP